jgi:hypothetical protein
MYQGLFSENHGILPETASGQLYAGLVVLFMVATYSLALSLEKISDLLAPWWRRFKGCVSPDNAGSSTEDGRRKERRSGEEASPVSNRDASDGSADVSKVSVGRVVGLRGWRGSSKRARADPVTQLESV